jgi:hypothetical protein
MTTDTTQTPSPVGPMPPVPTATSHQRGGGWLNVVLIVALALAVGGVAFAIGRSTAPAATTVPGFGPGANVGPLGSFAPGAGGGNGAGPDGLVGSGGLTIDGVVTSIDAGTMSVTLDSADIVTVTLDDATTYHSAAEASEEDVAVGDEVAVRVSGGGRFGFGPDASSAPSLTARDVTIIQ